jgi:hypothetical protein
MKKLADDLEGDPVGAGLTSGQAISREGASDPAALTTDKMRKTPWSTKYRTRAKAHSVS